jgi:hypothetical protein
LFTINFVIKSFCCRDTEQIFHRRFARKFPVDIQQRAFMKLNAVDAAVRLEDLRLPPSNRPAELKGIGKGNPVCESTSNGGSALFGGMGMQSRQKL